MEDQLQNSIMKNEFPFFSCSEFPTIQADSLQQSLHYIPDPNPSRDKEIIRLELELLLMRQKNSEQANLLGLAHDEISRQNAQISKLETEKWQLVLARTMELEDEKRTEGFAAEKIKLEQKLNDFEKEKQLRKVAELKAEKFKVVVKDLFANVADIIKKLHFSDDVDEIDNQDLLKSDSFTKASPELHLLFPAVLQNKLQVLFTAIQSKLDRFSEVQKEHCGVLTKNLESIQNMEVLFHSTKAANISSMLASTAIHVPPIEKISESASLPPRSPIRKRKRSEPVNNNKNGSPPPKRILRFSRRNSVNKEKADGKEATDIGNDQTIIHYKGKSVTDSERNDHSMPQTFSNQDMPSTTPGAENLKKFRRHGRNVSDPSYLRCLCGYKSPSMMALKLHISRSTSEPKFNCRKCDKVFVYGSILRCHYKSVHKIDWQFLIGCRLCGKQFQTKLALLAHHKAFHRNKTEISSLPKINTQEQGHHGDRPTFLTSKEGECQIQSSSSTSKELSTSVKTVKHRRIRNIPPGHQYKYHCMCGKKYNNYSSFRSHLHSKNKPNVFNCTLCTKTFNVHAKLKSHILRIHKIKYRNNKFGCFKCAQTFATLDALRKHKKLGHPELDNKSPSNPGASFTNLSNEKENFKNKESAASIPKMHGLRSLDNKNTACICGKTYHTRNALTKHINRLTLDPKFHCKQCTNKYVFRSELKLHYKTGHRIDWEFSYGCRLCGQMLPDSKSLTNHHITMHPTTTMMKSISEDSVSESNTEMNTVQGDYQASHEDLEEWQDNPDKENNGKFHRRVTELECVCGKKYSSSLALYNHIRSKVNPKEFKCPFCEKSSADPYSLRNHIQALHADAYQDDKVDYCWSCLKQFSNINELTIHRKQVHTKAKGGVMDTQE